MSKKAKKVLDRTDRRILECLQADGRISNVQLARKVNLTPTPCIERVKRLERQGVGVRLTFLASCTLEIRPSACRHSRMRRSVRSRVFGFLDFFVTIFDLKIVKIQNKSLFDKYQ